MLWKLTLRVRISRSVSGRSPDDQAELPTLCFRTSLEWIEGHKHKVYCGIKARRVPSVGRIGGAARPRGRPGVICHRGHCKNSGVRSSAEDAGTLAEDRLLLPKANSLSCSPLAIIPSKDIE